MNTDREFVRLGATLIAAVSLCLAHHGATAAAVHVDANCAPQLQGMDMRLFEKAHESPDALRRFVSIRHGMVSRTTMQAAEWADEVDQARSRCLASRDAVSPPLD
jgi:hypothetical protein